MNIPSLDFNLGETIEALRDTVQAFAAKEIAPRAAAVDRDNLFPADLWKKLGDLGLHGMTAPEEYGGTNMGYLAHIIALEEDQPRLRVGGPVVRRPLQPVHQPDPPQRQRRPAQKYLPKLISGDHVGALAMSEPGAGSDVVSMKLRADKKGDRFVLNGAKMWITNGGDADTLVVYAKTDIEAGAKGMTAFIVEKGMKGFTHGTHLDKLGMRGSNTYPLFFDDVEVPEENVLGGVGNGTRVLMSGLDYERAVLCGGPLGIMAACMDVVVPYLHDRKQFGQSIGEFQLMQGKLADMYSTWMACRAYVYAVGQACDRTDHARTLRKDAPAPFCTPPKKPPGWPARPSRPLAAWATPTNTRRPPVARRQAVRNRRRHQRNPPHADRPRTVLRNRLSRSLHPWRHQIRINPRAAEFQANAAAMSKTVADLRDKAAQVSLGGGEAARAKHSARGKLLPRDRVDHLLDPGTGFLEVGQLAAYWACTTTRRRPPG
jgi:isovaleryl-CoA dehydrogenase